MSCVYVVCYTKTKINAILKSSIGTAYTGTLTSIASPEWKFTSMNLNREMYVWRHSRIHADLLVIRTILPTTVSVCWCLFDYTCVVALLVTLLSHSQFHHPSHRSSVLRFHLHTLFCAAGCGNGMPCFSISLSSHENNFRFRNFLYIHTSRIRMSADWTNGLYRR